MGENTFTILWDNDGVLIDTEGLYFQACRAVLQTVGVELTFDRFREISLRQGESTLQLAAQRGIDDAGIERLRAQRDQRYVESLQTRSCVIDGAEEVLRSLYGRVRMGVVTSTLRAHFEAGHAASGLTQYLDFVIAREDYEHSKPHPEPYLTALARYGLQPRDCIVVEDTERGLASARAAGLDCLVVLSEWTKGGDFRDACRVLSSIREVPDEVLRRAAMRRDA